MIGARRRVLSAPVDLCGYREPSVSTDRAVSKLPSVRARSAVGGRKSARRRRETTPTREIDTASRDGSSRGTLKVHGGKSEEQNGNNEANCRQLGQLSETPSSIRVGNAVSERRAEVRNPKTEEKPRIIQNWRCKAPRGPRWACRACNGLHGEVRW